MRILLALDESPESFHAAQEAARLFSECGPEFLVISVAQAPVPWVPVGGLGAVPAPPPGWERDIGPPSESEVGLRAFQAGVRPTAVLAEVGDPVSCICQAADAYEVDLVVVGSHEKGLLRRLLEPSVSQGVVRNTQRPVLVVSGDEG